jgi:hypothetical protein
MADPVREAGAGVNALRKVVIRRTTPDGLAAEAIDAGPTPVPGLAVIWYRRGAHPGWEVVHEASGFAVACADGPEHALALAVALGRVADWTRAGSDLQAEPGLSGRVIAAVEHAGGWFRGVLASAEMVATAEAGGVR